MLWRWTTSGCTSSRIRSSSGRLSTLKQRMPAASARRISASDLPTPENRILSGSPPAARTRSSSPPETISKPLPSRANRSRIARLEQAIEHANELRERQQNDLAQAREGAREIAAHINKDRSEIEQLELTLHELEPDLASATGVRLPRVSTSSLGAPISSSCALSPLASARGSGRSRS